jgi:pimeloyl-ACP methyl ester carboxylesterase
MLRIDQNNPFIASWNESNARINPNRGEFLEKTIKKVKTVILYIPNCIAAACVNPRNESQFHPSPLLTRNYGSFTKEIITPDQVHLTAHVHVVREANSDTPTVLLFNPLGRNDSVHDEFKKILVKQIRKNGIVYKQRCNVITFNYRGFGSTWRAEDLVVDGESIYQYAIGELGTNKDKVHFYGLSLGGALAAQVKALHPESEGKYVGDRTFKSVFSLITEKCCIKSLGPLVKKITSLISAIFIAFPVYLLGWEWDGNRALARLKGDKRVVYHPNDCLIPFEASLASQYPAEQIRLTAQEIGPSTHSSTIDKKITVDGIRAAYVVAGFLGQPIRVTFQAAMTDLFIDPISHNRLRNPVANTPCGHTYEGSQINGWMTRCRTEGKVPDCPTCQEPITKLTPNMLARHTLDILDNPDNSSLNRVEDFTPGERRRLERYINRIRERRNADRQRGIPDRLPQPLTFEQMATDAVAASRAYYNC